MTPTPPQVVQVQMARAELRALQGQQAIAEYGCELLSGVAAELALTPPKIVAADARSVEQVMLSGIIALVSIRLAELQTAHSANAERIAQLEGFLRQADSGIVIPGLQVKN